MCGEWASKKLDKSIGRWRRDPSSNSEFGVQSQNKVGRGHTVGQGPRLCPESEGLSVTTPPSSFSRGDPNSTVRGFRWGFRVRDIEGLGVGERVQEEDPVSLTTLQRSQGRSPTGPSLRRGRPGSGPCRERPLTHIPLSTIT